MARRIADVCHPYEVSQLIKGDFHIFEAFNLVFYRYLFVPTSFLRQVGESFDNLNR